MLHSWEALPKLIGWRNQARSVPWAILQGPKPVRAVPSLIGELNPIFCRFHWPEENKERRQEPCTVYLRAAGAEQYKFSAFPFQLRSRPWSTYSCPGNFCTVRTLVAIVSGDLLVAINLSRIVELAVVILYTTSRDNFVTLVTGRYSEAHPLQTRKSALYRVGPRPVYHFSLRSSTAVQR